MLQKGGKGRSWSRRDQPGAEEGSRKQTWGQLQRSSGRQLTNAEDESERGERKFRILALG